MSRVLVTGAAGRLGGKIARALKDAGKYVIGVDMVEPTWPGHADAMDEFVKCNLSEEGCGTKVLGPAMKGVDAVVHCAAWPGPAARGPPAVARVGADKKAGVIIGLEPASPIQLLRDNLVMTAEICDAAVEAGVRRVVFSSSALQMGWSHNSKGPQSWNPNYLPVDETHESMPTETYGLSKQLSEEILRTSARTCKTISFVSLRFTNIIKTEMWSKLPWQAPSADSPPPLAFWAYTHEDDVVDVHVQSVVREGAAAVGEHEAYLIAAGDTRYAEPTLELMKNVLGANIRTTFHLEGNASPLCCRKARDRLGFAPRSWQGTEAPAVKRAKLGV